MAGMRLSDLFPSEVRLQDRRLEGITPKMLRAYKNPARLLPKAKATIKSLTGASKVKIKLSA